MPRNAEVIRQWTILRELEASRGATIRGLAETTGVTTRTIRRDLEALQEAGFPLYDVAGDGAKRWRLDTRPFKRLGGTAFTLAELSALYFSRTLVECFAVPPFGHDLRSALAKLEAALGPRMRQFLDRLPDVIQAKAPPVRRLDDRRQQPVLLRTGQGDRRRSCAQGAGGCRALSTEGITGRLRASTGRFPGGEAR